MYHCLHLRPVVVAVVEVMKGPRSREGVQYNGRDVGCVPDGRTRGHVCDAGRSEGSDGVYVNQYNQHAYFVYIVVVQPVSGTRSLVKERSLHLIDALTGTDVPQEPREPTHGEKASRLTQLA